MPTIKDVAKAVGVSITTVSRALNGYTDVNEETRRRIEQVAQDLGYSPNIAARSLVMKKTKTIGLLISGVTRSGAKDNFVYEVLCGMNDRSGELGFDLVLFSTTPQKQRTKPYTTLCKERGVDGVIIMGLRLDDPYLEEFSTATIPCVLIDIPLKGEKVGVVTTDNVYGAKKATKFLLDQGHRKIAFINGHPQADVSIKRLQGYQEALNQYDIPLEDSLIADGNFTEMGGMESAYRLIAANPEITAIFCASDLMALGAMQAIKNLGKKIPEDISVMGYDNIILSEYCTPSLTTIGQNRYEIGYQAAQLLIDMLEGRNVQQSVIINSDIILRDSVQTLRFRDGHKNRP